jgi:hypothetical protein
LTTIIAGNVSHMCSISAALDALDAAVAMVNALDVDRSDPVTRLRALERLETARRRQVVVSHDLIAGLVEEDPADVGGPVHKVIADWLRISCAEARRRMRDAEKLRPRVTFTGEVLPPELPATCRSIRRSTPSSARSSFWPSRRPNCGLTSWRRWRTGVRYSLIRTESFPTSTAPAVAASPGQRSDPTG